MVRLVQQMETGAEKLEYKAPLSGAFQLLGTTFSEDQLILNFDEDYRLQPVITEILVRAAIVRTLTQIDGVSYLSFQINSEPFLDASGALVGVMNADQFIDNAGNEINTYEKRNSSGDICCSFTLETITSACFSLPLTPQSSPLTGIKKPTSFRLC